MKAVNVTRRKEWEWEGRKEEREGRRQGRGNEGGRKNGTDWPKTKRWNRPPVQADQAPFYAECVSTVQPALALFSLSSANRCALGLPSSALF